MSLPFDFYATAIDSTSKHLTVAAHLPGRLQGLDAARNRNAAPARCSAWFGRGLGYYS
jgi:hypothetical protein